MKQLISTILLLSSFAIALQAQQNNLAGNAIRISYLEYTQDNTVKYINCGNNESLNLGEEATLETWIRISEVDGLTNNNMKLMGKLNGSFNSGYMLGLQVGLYAEVWNPTLNELQSGVVPPNETWAHLAVTYQAGGQMRGYINGNEVADFANISASGITPNNDPLIIGIAPWDLANFQTFGEFDEVRIWNVARSAEEIAANMHIPLTGQEEGLVAYYDFNEENGSNLPDLTGNGNDGNLVAMSDNNWISSRAVLGGESMRGQLDIHAVWKKTLLPTQSAATTNGLSLVATTDTLDYFVFGHNGVEGTSTTAIPADAPSNFQKTGRNWHLISAGDATADLAFDLDNAAGAGEVLPTDKDAEYYTLLYRENPLDTYSVFAQANSKNNNVVSFTGLDLPNGYYAIGVGEEPFTNVKEIIQSNTVKIYPNPSNGKFNVQLQNAMGKNISLSVFNILGEEMYRYTAKAESDLFSKLISLDDMAAGNYLLNINMDGKTHTQVLVKE